MRAWAMWAAAMAGNDEEPRADAWLKMAAMEAEFAADCEAALLARWAKSNFNLSEVGMAASMLLLLVSDGLSSLLVGLLGGEWDLATVEKADFSLTTMSSGAFDLLKNPWWGREAAKRLL